MRRGGLGLLGIYMTISASEWRCSKSSFGNLSSKPLSFRQRGKSTSTISERSPEKSQQIFIIYRTNSIHRSLILWDLWRPLQVFVENSRDSAASGFISLNIKWINRLRR